MFGHARFSFDRSLSLLIIYVLLKIEENLCCPQISMGFSQAMWPWHINKVYLSIYLDFFNFSAHASSNSAIILAARCWQKPILKADFNWEDDTGSNYLLDRPT